MEDPEARDLVGHGTACAGIVAGVAPGASLVSIRMLGADNRGKGRALAAAVEWTVGQGIAVVNLSLSSRSEAMFAAFHAPRRPLVLRQHAARLRRQQRARAVVPVVVRGRPVGRRA